MKWQALISKVNNGYKVDFIDGEGKKTFVYAEKDNVELSSNEEDKEHTVEMLWEILEFFAETGSKHDKKRINIEYKKQ
jgi:hypothetical protein